MYVESSVYTYPSAQFFANAHPETPTTDPDGGKRRYGMEIFARLRFLLRPPFPDDLFVARSIRTIASRILRPFLDVPEIVILIYRSPSKKWLVNGALKQRVPKARCPVGAKDTPAWC